VAVRYDLAIVGSGGAGFAAAITARRLGASVVMVEAATVGGACVNAACVPSKALLAAAEAREVALTAQRFPGITATAGPVAMGDLIAGKEALVLALRAGKYLDLADEYGWRILAGTARFAGTRSAPVLDVDLHDGGTTRIEAARYLLATGSAPTLPAVDGLAEAGYLTSATAMQLDRLPASMIVLGGGAVGLEQAQLFARLGTEVTVVESWGRLAPAEEPEVSQAIAQVFTGEDITVHTGASATRVTRGGGHLTMMITDLSGTKKALKAEHLLAATGRRPVTAGLNLSGAGVETGDRGQIVVDAQLRTGNPRVFAAGDVTGAPQFVYVAARQGSIAADNALTGAGRVFDDNHLPRVTFTSPAIASVGLTCRQAAQTGYVCDCRVLPLEAVPRAVVDRDTRGVIKLVADTTTGRLLGVHAVCDAAGELAATAVYALAANMTVAQVAELWCPYLTMAEGLKLAALSFTRDVAKLSCCAV